MRGYPPGSYSLIFIQLFESFSFFGMRTLLVLFMIQQLGYEDSHAIGIYALYATLINLGGLAGGYCGDRILGLRAAVVLGSMFIAIGHICLAFEVSTLMFHLGLSALIVGSAFFGANMKGLFGQLFTQDDPRRESGYTLYYTGINLGGFSAAVVCGYVAQIYGWHAGFGLAALGMLAGLTFLFKSRTLLQNKGGAPLRVPTSQKFLCCIAGLAAIALCMVIFHAHHLIIPLLPFLGVMMVGGMLYRLRNSPYFKQTLSLCGFIGLYLVFFMIEDLMGTLLMIFCENQVDRQFLGLEIPSSALVAVNPLTIIILGTLFASIIRYIRPNQTIQSLMRMNSIAFILLGLAFGMLFLGTLSTDALGLIPLPSVIISFVLIAIGELFIAPSLLTFCSVSMPAGLTGQAMGLLAIGRSYASLFSGMLGQFIVRTEMDNTVFFVAIAFVLFAIGACLACGASVRSYYIARA